MNKKILLIVAAAALGMLGACEKSPDAPKPPESPATAETTVAKETPETQAPEATLTCPSTTTKKIVAASGEKTDATDQAVETAKATDKDAAFAATRPWVGKTFEEFLPTVTKECGDDGKYIVNGDVAISDIKQLREFFERSVQNAPDPTHELIVNTVGGSITAWSAAQKKQITYCIHNFFNSKKPQVIADMAAAAGAWEAVSDVKFVYVPAQDASCNASNSSVVFDVRPVNVNGDYLARAFFPNEPRANRNVLIDLSALSLSGGDLTLAGVLRHELGHTLGFRHEHTRPESGACFEDSNWKPITSYDKFSVMHYPQCNGGADWKLLLTDRDKNGSACVYGSAPGFTLVPSMVVDATQCTNNLPIPPQGPVTVSHTAQTVTKNQQKTYPVLAGKPGSVVKFKMTGSGASSGDPDLYVSLGTNPPRVSPPRFNCRPYLTGPNEICELTVRPVPNNQIRYMVHGYTAGAYDLQVSYVPFTNP